MSSLHWRFGPFQLDPNHACLWHDAQAIALTPKAFSVLQYLVTHSDRLVTKDELFEAIWPATAVSEAALRVCIGELRKALNETAHTPRYIATMHRRGYRFLAPVTQTHSPATANGWPLVPFPGVGATVRASPSAPMPPQPLVGREAVLRHIHAALAQARQEARQLVMVTGEPGMGKTTVVEALLERGLLEARDGLWQVTAGRQVAEVGVPEGLRPLLEQQLLRLPSAAQHVVAAASVVGIAFSAAAVAAGLGTHPASVETCCEHLALQHVLGPAKLVTWPNGSVSMGYTFRHVLYQQVAYERLGPGRRAHMHQRIGECLEAVYGAQTTEIAAELAMHFARGQDVRRAVQYYRQAADTATKRSAHDDVIKTLARALDLLQGLPETAERAQHELALQIALGPALVATRGYAASEVEQTYARACELCQQVGKPRQLFWVLFGLRLLYQQRAEFAIARTLETHLFEVAQGLQDQALLLVAHQALGASAYWLGEFTQAHTHLEQGIALSASLPRDAFPAGAIQHPAVACLAFGARVLWRLGYPDQALRWSQDALTLAREQSHPFSLAYALSCAAKLHQLRGEWHTTQAHAEAAMALAAEQGFALWLAMGTILHGSALAARGWPAEGIAQMRQGLVAYRATGTMVAHSYWLGLLAEACGRAGHAEEGLGLLAEALMAVHTTGERFDEAELYRIKGDILLALSPDHASEAEGCFCQALAVARSQQAKSLELRAAIRLSRLWQHQGRHDDARQLLGDIEGWFVEGLDTEDLQASKALLATLA